MEEVKQAQPVDAVSQGDRILAAVGYVPFVCLVPLFGKKDSAFVQHHAKQGFLLFAIWVALQVVGWFPIVGWMAWFFGGLAVLVLAIYGMYMAATGVRWEMPFLGAYAKQLQF